MNPQQNVAQTDTSKDTPFELLTGGKHPQAPDYFSVVMKVTCQDGTEYLAGYNNRHHPFGVPQIALTFRRLSLKLSEQRKVNKVRKAVEALNARYAAKLEATLESISDS